jgi:hypothetical protein
MIISFAGGLIFTHDDLAHALAVTARSNGNTYVYDYNGNHTRREIGYDTYDLKYDAEELAGGGQEEQHGYCHICL